MNRASSLKEIYPVDRFYFDTTLVPIGFNFDIKSANQTYKTYPPIIGTKEEVEDKKSEAKKEVYYF